MSIPNGFKPCPFCNTEPIVSEESSVSDGSLDIDCASLECGAASLSIKIGELMTVGERLSGWKENHYSKIYIERATDKAREVWNTRHSEAELEANPSQVPPVNVHVNIDSEILNASKNIDVSGGGLFTNALFAYLLLLGFVVFDYGIFLPSVSQLAERMAEAFGSFCIIMVFYLVVFGLFTNSKRRVGISLCFSWVALVLFINQSFS